MGLECKVCGAAIPSADINIDALMAKCSSCDSVFSFADEGGHTKHRDPVALPSGMTVTDTGRELTITRRWFTPAAIFLVFFAVLWDGFMLVWYGIAFSQRIWPMALFGTLHALVGVGVAYAALAACLNRTVIRVRSDRIEVRHAPIPSRGNLLLKAEHITQLWCRMETRHSRNGVNTIYEVHARNSQGQTKRLVGGLAAGEQALYIEQEIERFLGLRDERVPGEMDQ